MKDACIGLVYLVLVLILGNGLVHLIHQLAQSLPLRGTP